MARKYNQLLSAETQVQSSSSISLFLTRSRSLVHPPVHSLDLARSCFTSHCVCFPKMIKSESWLITEWSGMKTERLDIAGYSGVVQARRAISQQRQHLLAMVMSTLSFLIRLPWRWRKRSQFSQLPPLLVFPHGSIWATIAVETRCNTVVFTYFLLLSRCWPPLQILLNTSTTICLPI